MKKIISIISAIAVAMSVSVSAFAFTDMPTGEIGTALQNAVDAGLINGYNDDTIKPDNMITRAEMAAIITRAFGATEMSDKQYNDVPQSAWYYDEVSKAVAMGAFHGDDEFTFAPERNITFQETYIVLSRVFAFEPYEVSGSKLLVGDVEATVLDGFSDTWEFAKWAVNGAKYVVGNGGWNGIDNMLKPKSFITRGEFALLMDSIVDRYIDEPGEVKNIGNELVIVRSGGVTIDGMQSNKNLILAYSVDERGVVVKNSTINGVTLVLGGADKSIDASTNKPDASHIKIDNSNIYDLRVMGKYIWTDATTSKVLYANVPDASNRLSLQFTIGG